MPSCKGCRLSRAMADHHVASQFGHTMGRPCVHQPWIREAQFDVQPLGLFLSALEGHKMSTVQQNQLRSNTSKLILVGCADAERFQPARLPIQIEGACRLRSTSRTEQPEGGQDGNWFRCRNEDVARMAVRVRDLRWVLTRDTMSQVDGGDSTAPVI
jgi:hypothetical protein